MTTTQETTEDRGTRALHALALLAEGKTHEARAAFLVLFAEHHADFLERKARGEFADDRLDYELIGSLCAQIGCLHNAGCDYLGEHSWHWLLSHPVNVEWKRASTKKPYDDKDRERFWALLSKTRARGCKPPKTLPKTLLDVWNWTPPKKRKKGT